MKMNYISKDSLIRAGCVDVSTLPSDHPVSIILSDSIKCTADKLANDIEDNFLQCLLDEKAE